MFTVNNQEKLTTFLSTHQTAEDTHIKALLFAIISLYALLSNSIEQEGMHKN